MDLVIKSKNNFSRQIIEVLSIFNPLKKLSDKEKDLLAVIMDEFHMNDNVSEQDIPAIVFSSSNRGSIAKMAGITKNNMYVYICKFHKLKILDKNNNLLPFLRSIKYKNTVVNIKILIDDQETEGL